MAWIASEFAQRVHCIDCAALICHTHKCMDDWISLDTFLFVGNHLEIQVAEEGMRDQIKSNNPKFQSKAEHEGLQNPGIHHVL